MYNNLNAPHIMSGTNIVLNAKVINVCSSLSFINRTHIYRLTFLNIIEINKPLILSTLNLHTYKIYLFFKLI